MNYIKYIAAFLILSSPLFSQVEGTPEIIRGDEQFILMVKTNDTNTKIPLNGTEVYLYETASNALLATEVTINGLAEFNIQPSTEYEVRTCHPNYLKGGMSIYECNEGNEVLCTFGASDYSFVAGGGPDKPVALLKATIELQSLSIGSIFELQNVYYDLDKATLRKRGKQELDDLAKIMKRNQSITIELSSHTDSRASNAYNNDLSQRRAKSCYDYLKSRGIAASRITPKGYGETKLLNKCSDGIECTEEQHQKNRRTEIEILTYEPIKCSPVMEMDFKNKDLIVDMDDKK